MQPVTTLHTGLEIVQPDHFPCRFSFIVVEIVLVARVIFKKTVVVVTIRIPISVKGLGLGLGQLQCLSLGLVFFDETTHFEFETLGFQKPKKSPALI